MKKIKFNGWAILTFIVILMIIIPNLEIIIKLFGKPSESWGHIKEYLLIDYVKGSTVLVVFTALFTMIIGVTLSTIISLYEFPLRSFYRWALMLPLAIPPYIAAYTYSGIVGYTGPIQRFLRNVININVDQRYFDIMSMQGAIFIFTLFLYPYVYMLTKSFLEKQSSALIENAFLLGSGHLGVFFRVIIPISRGVIVSGITLVALEVLSDYGVVSYFGVPTFSAAIFKSWLSLRDMDSAIRLAGILVVVVFSIMILEKFLRGRKKFSFTNTKIKPIKRKKVEGIYSIMATGFCTIIFALGFVIPVSQMIVWALQSYKNIYYDEFIGMILNSIWIAIIPSLIIVITALILANYTRMKENILSKVASKITLLGYSIPGTVIALTMLLFFVKVDNIFSGIYKFINPNLPKMFLSTSVIMLIFAYVIRFLGIGYESIEGGFSKVGNKFTEASTMLGYGRSKTFFKVDLPLVKKSVLAAFALTFVEIIKELSIVLTLRPFNFSTLSTKVFEYANDEMIPESSLPSLIIVIVSMAFIYVMYKVMDGEDEKDVC